MIQDFGGIPTLHWNQNSDWSKKVKGIRSLAILCQILIKSWHIENRTEEVNEYIAKYKLHLEPHTIIGRLEETVNDFSSLDQKSLLGMAARSQRYY